jgi:hypothetical protein
LESASCLSCWRTSSDVAGGRGNDALRRRGHLARCREIEIVLAGERIGLLLANLEDAREAVLGEGVQRLFEGALVEIGLLHQLAEVRLAVDELQDLHQVLRKRGGFLVDLGDAFRGLRENRIAIHVSPRLVVLSPSVQ